MKLSITLFALLFSMVVFGQSAQYNLTPVQAGTVTLVNGKATINLDDNTLSSLSPRNGGEAYYVELTPIGDCGVLKLDKKGNKSFTVSMAGTGNGNGTFDYIVFLKAHLIQLNQTLPDLKSAPATGK
jgi:hypothetical protein